jgi:sugar phosphate isomerase/epimerase
MLSSEWSTTAGESLPRQTNQAEMKLCAVSESLGHLPFPEAAKVSADLGLAGLEIGHGKVKDRSWSYVTLGYGHGELWWREFCYALRLNGYDGWLSIEHEDIVLSRMEGIRRSVDLLKRTMIEEPSDYVLPNS